MGPASQRAPRAVMRTPRLKSFTRSVENAEAWLSEVASRMRTDDRKVAFRALRVWLHMLRDRLTVDGAVKFGGHLPELLRGIYYDSWEPSAVPVTFDRPEYVRRFASEARIPVTEVPAAAAAITAAMAARMSPRQVEEAFAQLPGSLREVIGWPEAAVAPAREPGLDAEIMASIGELRKQIDVVRQAIRTLATGLEEDPQDGPDAAQRRSRAARLVAELLTNPE